MTAADLQDLESVHLAIADVPARLDLPVGWAVDPGPPVVATPPSWDGDPPAVVISIAHDALRGEALAAAVTDAALTRLGDPVIVSLIRHTTSADNHDTLDSAHSRDDHDNVDSAHRHGHGNLDSGHDPGDDRASGDHGPDGASAGLADEPDLGDVEIVVAHQHRGVDVTTVERHHCRPGPVRWVVGFTLAHRDVPRWLPLARRVVASLRAAPS